MRARAVLSISDAIAVHARAAELYSRASEPLDYLFGGPDFMAVAGYAGRLPRVAAELRLGGGALPRLRLELFAKGERTQVLGVPVDISKLEPAPKPRDALASWQVLPTRLTLESAVFQELAYSRVAEFLGDGFPFTLGIIAGRPTKAFPSILELAALLESEDARRHLNEAGETVYEGYEEVPERAAQAMDLASGIVAEHTELFRDSLNLAAVGSTRPDSARRFNRELRFWTQQRHGALLQVRQSYTARGKGLALRNYPGRSQQEWIEPAESLYWNLARIAQEVSHLMGFDPWARFAEFAGHSTELSSRSFREEKFDPEPAAFQNTIEAGLRELTRRLDDGMVANVYTDGNSGMVAQIALGKVRASAIEYRGDTFAWGALFQVHQSSSH